MTPQRILIIGDGGSGKSTFAIKLGAAKNIPVTHLDLLRCDDTFTPVAPDVYRRRHDAVLRQDRWIVEGIPRGYWETLNDDSPLNSPTLRQRMNGCDAVVYLDYSPPLTLWRSWRRSLDYAASRTAIPEHARYRFNLFNIKRTLIFYFWIRPELQKALSVLRSSGKLILVASDDRQLESALARLT